MERFQDVVFRTAYLVTRDAGEAEDAAQEAFVKAFRALDRFRPDASFRPWILRIVANEARNRRKAAGRRERLALRAADTESSVPSPEADVCSRDLRDAVLSAMGLLSEEDQAVISYRYLLDLSEAEMAQLLDCPRGTVKSRLARALARLRTEVLTRSAGEALAHG